VKRWAELKAAFWDLADLEPSERAHRLALLASTDPELHQHLEPLLAADVSGKALQDLFAVLPPPSPQPPARVGPYEVTGVLGAGGMGEVYRARDPRLLRDVAVKVLPAAWATERRRLARFEREARVLAALNHPNIAAIYGLEGESPDDGFEGPALILELVEGETLAERIARASDERSSPAGGPPRHAVPIAEALAIAGQIADALDAAHKKGIVHRDLKPANVKIRPDGRVKVLDFGLAKMAPDVTLDDDPLRVTQVTAGETRDGQILGTAAYMSPEQARGHEIDTRTDIWAFGCVLYEMLAGRALFAAHSVHETIAAIFERTPDWNALPPETPGAIRTLLIRALAKDREQRLEDISEARRKIDRALDEQHRIAYGPATRERHNLPLQTSALIGRHAELAEVGGLLRKHRCLTLVGPGGSGKTRLALESAAHALDAYRDGVWWVPLASISDLRLVLPEVARILEVAGDLSKCLLSKELLLILDNLEQVIECASQLADLLAAAGGLRLLVTSREPLHIDAERVYAVEPLIEDEAAALFKERAVISEPQSAVREICRRVDCLPLAVELAAARTGVLPPEQLLARLGDGLSLLATRRRDAPARQRTLRATIQWSHDLLTDAERTLFRRLAIFAGGWTVEAADAVVGADLDTLQVLVDRSLVRRSTVGRFQMLETIGEFAKEQLAADAAAHDLAARHSTFYLALAERATSHLREARQRERLDELERERANFRSALSWSLSAGRTDWALRLCAALQFFWMYHSHIVEGRRWVADVLSADRNAAQRSAADLDPLRAPVLGAASVLAALQNDYAAGEEYAAQYLDLSRRLGDTRNEANALLLLGRPALARGAPAQARQILEAAVERARQAGDAWCEAMATFNLAYLALSVRDFSRARTDMQSSLEQFQRLHDQYGVARSYTGLGAIAVHSGEMSAAIPALRESLTLGLALGDREGPAWGLELMAAAVAPNRPVAAARLLGAAETLREELGLTLSGAEADAHERAVADIRASMDTGGLIAALAAGRDLSLADAVALAIEQTDVARS
jgi:predicted ATPase/serine/threonine protein kinase